MARDKNKQVASLAADRAGDISTNPLGLTTEAETAKKKLLGE